MARPPEKLMKEQYCFVCGVAIAECMGFTVAGDFMLALEGKLPWPHVRERCAVCGVKALVEKTPPSSGN